MRTPAPTTTPVFLREAQVLERYGLKHANLWAMIKDGRFPAPVHPSPGTTAWVVAETDAWALRLIAERDGRAA